MVSYIFGRVLFVSAFACLCACAIGGRPYIMSLHVGSQGTVFLSRDGKVTSRGTLCTEPSSCNTNHVERCIRTMPL